MIRIQKLGLSIGPRWVIINKLQFPKSMEQSKVVKGNNDISPSSVLSEREKGIFHIYAELSLKNCNRIYDSVQKIEKWKEEGGVDIDILEDVTTSLLTAWDRTLDFRTWCWQVSLNGDIPKAFDTASPNHYTALKLKKNGGKNDLVCTQLTRAEIEERQNELAGVEEDDPNATIIDRSNQASNRASPTRSPTRSLRESNYDDQEHGEDDELPPPPPPISKKSRAIQKTKK